MVVPCKRIVAGLAPKWTTSRVRRKTDGSPDLAIARETKPRARRRAQTHVHVI